MTETLKQNEWFRPGFPSQHSFAAAFSEVALAHPTLPALINDATKVSYGQLLIGAIAIAQRFRGLGVDHTSVVALNTGDTAISLSCLVATSLLGSQLVNTSEVLSKRKTVQPTHFFKTVEAKGKKGVDFIEIEASWFADVSSIRPSALSEFEGYADPEDPWLILHTSGTTGRPKFMGLSHRVVAERTRAISTDFPRMAVTCVLLFKCTSRPFFARAIGALQNGCTIVDSSSCSLWKKNGVNTIFCSPSQIVTFMARFGLSGRYRRLEISGAKLEDDLVRSLSDHFDEIIDVYGASETNKTFANYVSLTADGEVRRHGRKLDSEIEILDADGATVPAGETGTVRVRNTYMIPGYIENPEATAKNFRDGWFYPGDVGRISDTGELQILGRDDELISFGGIKLDARLIDEILKSVAGVSDAICVKSPKADRNEVIGFVVLEDDVDRAYTVDMIRKAYRDYTGLPIFLGPIHVIDEIPYSDEGHPLREACAELVLQRIGSAGAPGGSTV